MKTITVKGFSSTITADPTLAVAVYGAEGSGKTEFACTAPGVVGVIPLERKCKQTVFKAREKYGKTIFLPEQDFIRVRNPVMIANLRPEKCGAPPTTNAHAPVCCSPHYYRWHVNSIKQAAMDLYNHPDVNSIVIDSATQLWDDILCAHYGRTDRIMPLDRRPANQEFIELVNALSGKHLVLTHRASRVWKGNTETDKLKLDGFHKVGFFVSAVVETTNDATKSEGDDEWFTLDVKMCQARPGIAGKAGVKALCDGAMTFANLALLIFPDSEPELWM